MIDTLIKVEIAKELLIKSGFDNDRRAFYSVVTALRNDRFLFELENNELILFVSWENSQYIDGKNKVFINNLWIDPRYRNKKYVFRVRTLLRDMFRNTRGIWFNRKKQKIIERK